MDDARGPWTRADVLQFLNQFFRGGVTLSQLVEEARGRFPNQKAVIHREVDRYLEVFVLDVLRIVTKSNLIDALLTAETSKGRLGDIPPSEHPPRSTDEVESALLYASGTAGEGSLMNDRGIVDVSRAVAEAVDECGCGFFVLLNRALQEERAAARRDALNGRGLGIAAGNNN